MQKIEIDRIESITGEIIEALEEDMPDDKSGLLCAKTRNSPFRQLVGLLEMEMAAIRIMHSEEPFVPETEIDEISPTQPAPPVEIIPQPVAPPPVTTPHIAGKTPEPRNNKLREPSVSAAEPAKITQEAIKELRVAHKTEHENSSAKPHTHQDFYEKSYFKSLLAGGGLLLVLLPGYLLLRQQPAAAPPAKVVVNWSDVEKGKTSASDLKDKVNPQQKRSARSFYTLGKAELGKNNLRAAREYFRTAVSLDPSSEEYMDAYRQVDHSMRRKKSLPQMP
ncbi:MAG: hypothetical protein CVV41_02760 [Candidatus Riflebacteria bacterium HGW-Riflebacteria-1]|jgi:hypothetical protein|nr:MAG: hypothetical protein CVV41_02760 [Candidatus Riflebacteria bacterium HGW-Riflebacteria-1]